MASNDSIQTGSKASLNDGFRLSGGPVAYLSEDQEGGGNDFAELSQLPRVYGEPILFAIPRDPRTLFTYWNVDWAGLFKKTEPFDRQVYLRVKKSDGAEESESLIEPMLGSYYALVAQPRGVYRVELGYYQPASEWHSIASSEEVEMPPESVSEKVAVDVVTVPFHLSFQRIVDIFHGSNGDALVDSLSQLQERTAGDEESLTMEERAKVDQLTRELEALRPHVNGAVVPPSELIVSAEKYFDKQVTMEATLVGPAQFRTQGAQFEVLIVNSSHDTMICTLDTSSADETSKRLLLNKKENDPIQAVGQLKKSPEAQAGRSWTVGYVFVVSKVIR